jgi:hypothetical protein
LFCGNNTLNAENSVKTSFQFIGLSADPFAPLFNLSNAELQAMGARRMIVDEKPGFPCRISLVDADVGETVLLVPFTHHDVSSPYRACGPIYVRPHAITVCVAPNDIPAMFFHRLLSVRAYDEEAMMVGAEVVDGNKLETSIRHFFANANTRYLHIHNASPGCYNCRVVRV